MYIKNKMADAQYENFYVELHALLSAGLDFSHAFVLLIESERNPRMKRMLEHLYNNVVEGAALWQSMERSRIFRSLDCGVVRIGEQTGRLTDTLSFLWDYYRKRSARRKMISSAISYPVVILSTAIAVVNFMLTVIVPMFEQVYTRMGSELPSLTQWIIAISDSLPRYIRNICVITILTYLVLYINRKREEVQAWTSGLLLHLPIIGVIIRKNQQAQFCKLLYMLTSSGVPLLESMDMLAKVIDFYPYKKSFCVVCHKMERGEQFSVGLGEFPDLYDRKLIALVKVGEETNRLSEMLYRQGEAFTEELEFRIKRMGALIEPILILMIGLIVAIILISMYMPMFRLGGIMG